MARLQRWTVCALVAGALTAIDSGCDDPVAALTGVTAISTQVQGHTHRCSVPLSDIEDPPAGGRSYTTTTEDGHAHVVPVSENQLRDLQQGGAAVSVVSASAGATPHTHRFDFVR